MKAAPAAAFDWKNPDYAAVFAQRAKRLARIRTTPGLLEALRGYYGQAEHAADFISDFGTVFEPRNAERNLPTTIPFILFPKQVDWVSWALDLWRRGLPGLTEKSRDCGISTLAMALSCWMCVFRQGMAIGVGSATEAKVDRGFDPDTLMFKARMFLMGLPPELRGGFDAQRHAAHMRLYVPETGSSITGQSGDDIGRGGRKAIYWVDESAHLERPRSIEASLASTTNCRMDISSVSGLANPFAEKRHSGRVSVFTFRWSDDPRKGREWYEKQRSTLDPVTLSQEVDLNYLASMEGALIPSAWAQSAVGALERLGLKPSGTRRAALDVADQGVDKNAFAGRHGPLLEFLTSWSGANSDIFATTQTCFALCDTWKYTTCFHDADGLGAGVRGDARVINEQRTGSDRPPINVEPYRGSASPEDPTSEMIEGRKNEDFFSNLKAQAYFALRERFKATHRAIETGHADDPDKLISISPELDELNDLLSELAQIAYKINAAGKVVIDKAPAGFKSPNLADAVCMVFAPICGTAELWMRLASP